MLRADDALARIDIQVWREGVERGNVRGIADEKQPQILRLTIPKLDPKEQRSLFGDPGKRLGPRSLRMTTPLFINQ
jgi:hypothetical protein